MGAVQMERVRGVGRGGMELRWYFVALVTAAIVISYFDRQTLPVAISAIQRSIPISNQQFSYLQTSFLLAYAALYAIGGRLLDRLGTRRGFMLIMVWWSVACMLHGLATGFMFLLVARFLLGMGDGGAGDCGVDCAGGALDRDGHHQCGDGGGLAVGAAVDWGDSADGGMAGGVFCCGEPGDCVGDLVDDVLPQQHSDVVVERAGCAAAGGAP
jgi:MFS family permease